MAPKKKPDLSDEVRRKMKEEMIRHAQAAIKAGKRLLREPAQDDGLGYADIHDTNVLGYDLDQTIKDVEAANRAFGEEEVLQKQSIVDLLRKKAELRGTQLRVLRVGPTGRYVDITDEVKDKDLVPEGFVGFRDEDVSKTYPISRDPKNREEAMRLLQDLIPGVKATGKPESVRRMEAVLEESEKTLDHWKD